MQKIVFIDRDGVICENRADYVKNWQEFEFLPNVLEALAVLNQAGYKVVIVTNQSAIGRGLMSLADLQDIHTRMVNVVRQAGGDIEEIFYCPHQPEDQCYCRKPQPGMLNEAAEKLNIDLSRAYMIGDACTDIQAGQAVDCTSFLVLTGRGLAQLSLTLRQASANFHVVPHLDVAVKHIISNDQRRLTHLKQTTNYTSFISPFPTPVESV